MTGSELTTEGIEAVFLDTHNWGRSARFFQSLGFQLEFATDHNSGLLRNGDGPYLFIVEVPEDQEPRTRIVLKVPDADAFRPDADAGVEVVTPFEDTHYGTREMTVRDPDGRLWSLQAPGKSWPGQNPRRPAEPEGAAEPGEPARGTRGRGQA